MIELTDRVALVTGGSRGIGRAIALKLAERGARVVVNYYTDSDAADAEEVVATIQAGGGEAVTVQGDVRSADDARNMAEVATSTYGRLDILVNNAGVTQDTLLARMSEAQWDMVLDTNLKGAYHCTKASVRPMMRQRYGRIINISSVAGIAGNAGQANYSAAKAGLIGFTKALAKELGARNITVNAVAPGFVQTTLTADLPQEFVDKALELTPLARFATPEDIANAVAFLASDEAALITGQVLRVDGGMVF